MIDQTHDNDEQGKIHQAAHGPEPRSTNPKGLSPGGETAMHTEPQDAAFRAGRTASTHRWLMYLVGAVSILAGLAAITMPLMASLTATVVVASALVASGMVGLFSAFKRKEGWHLAAVFAMSLLSLVVGVFMLVQPFVGILALSTVIIAWFAGSGVVRIYYGVRMFGQGGGWMVAVGAVSLVLGLLLWFGLPFNAFALPGILLAVDLILWGAVLFGLGAMTGHPRGPLDVSASS